MSFGASGGGGSASKSASYNYGRFPGEFVSDAGRVVGQPLTLQELLAGLPVTSGLFGGGGGSFYRGGAPGGTASGEFGQQGVTAGGTTGGRPTVDPRTGQPVISGPSNPPASVGSVIGHDLLGVPGPNPPGVILPGAPSLYSDIDPASEAARNRINPASTDTGMGLFNRIGLANTGIGAPAPTYQAPTDVNRGITGPEGDPLRAALYSQNYDPAARDIRREGELADRKLSAILANSGLASSGTGVGQLQRQQENRNVQLGNLATDAAATSTVQAATLLQTGDIANARNYLDTLGLNQKAATEARDSFLKYLNLQEDDLARLDKQHLDALGLAFKTYLDQYATLGNIGRSSTGTEASARTGEVHGGGGFSLGGAGGGGGGGPSG